jgi:succinyl-diaminopimelate desuccinylase
VDGTVKVVEVLKKRGETMDYCIVGEPTSVDALGDYAEERPPRLALRAPDGARRPGARRLPAPGAQSRCTSSRRPGRAGENAMGQGQRELSADHLAGFEHPRRHGVGNVIPGRWRSISISASRPKAPTRPSRSASRRSSRSTAGVLDCLGARRQALPQRQRQARADGHRDLQARTGHNAELSTTGGTSDARFIIEIAPEVLEIGPVNASIHKLNEHIEVSALEQLSGIYLDVLRALLP